MVSAVDESHGSDILSGIDPVSAKKQYQLYVRMLGGLGAVAVLFSFVEADQRGLLFAQDDFAFVADDVALAVPNGSTGQLFAFAPGSGRVLRQRDTRRSVRNPLSNGILGSPVNPDTSPAGGGAARLIEAAPDSRASVLPVAGQPGIVTLANSLLGSSGPSIDFPDSPLALIPVANQPGPVVPAVPEPASWLLMIIGVGWLGIFLRRREQQGAFAL